MFKKLTYILLLILLVACSSEEKTINKKEYTFSPIGWKFHLPEYWIPQKGSDIDKVLEKYGKKAGIGHTQIEAFQNQKVFMLETKVGFNQFTSEVTSFSGSKLDLENGVLGYKKQLMSQLKGVSPHAEVTSGDVNPLLIDGQKFNVFEVKFKFNKNKDEYFYMQVYIGLVKNHMLATSYTCILGTNECNIVKQAFEKSTFNKI